MEKSAVVANVTHLWYQNVATDNGDLITQMRATEQLTEDVVMTNNNKSATKIGIILDIDLDSLLILMFVTFIEPEKKKEGNADGRPKKMKRKQKMEKKKETEATFEILNSPARVIKPQLQVMRMENPTSIEKALYAPIKDTSIGGKAIHLHVEYFF